MRAPHSGSSTAAVECCATSGAAPALSTTRLPTDPARAVSQPVFKEPGQDWVGLLAFPFGRGIRQKLVLVSLAILIVASFGFLLLHRLISSTWIDEDLRHRAILFGQGISVTLHDDRFASRAALARDIRQIVAVRSDVLQMDVLRYTPESAELVASSHPRTRLPFSRADSTRVRQGHVVSRLAALGEQRAWDTLVPIIIEGEVIGALSTRFSLDNADRLSYRINLWALVFTGISVVLMGCLMVVAVSYTVNRPIRQFLAATRQIRDGGASARVQVQTGDEFEILASHFNGMMARINSFSEELDERVRAATRELDERYQELQRLNQLLYATQRKLTQAERLALAGQVVAQVAHEVGTPLHSVAGHLELMRAELPADTPAGVARRLDIVDDQITRVSGIIRQLLELVRRDRPPFVAVDVNTLVHAAAELVSPGASAAGLELRLELEPDLPSVIGNSEQLTQALLNLLANAIDATPAGGTITVSAQPHVDEIAIAVRDTGSGIPAERQREIFEPFVSSKPHGQGTGLGLYIADQIVRDHRGRIVVESTEGQGTTMTIWLPTRGERS